MSVLQVHFDLGGIYFQQGCSDHSAYEKAREHFRLTRELLSKVRRFPFTRLIIQTVVHLHLYKLWYISLLKMSSG